MRRARAVTAVVAIGLLAVLVALLWVRAITVLQARGSQGAWTAVPAGVGLALTQNAASSASTPTPASRSAKKRPKLPQPIEEGVPEVVSLFYEGSGRGSDETASFKLPKGWVYVTILVRTPMTSSKFHYTYDGHEYEFEVPYPATRTVSASVVSEGSKSPAIWSDKKTGPYVALGDRIWVTESGRYHVFVDAPEDCSWSITAAPSPTYRTPYGYPGSYGYPSSPSR